MMKMHAWMAACAVALLPLSAAGQDAKKWKPYQFAGNERYEFKIARSRFSISAQSSCGAT